jgi:hypothetical protein
MSFYDVFTVLRVESEPCPDVNPASEARSSQVPASDVCGDLRPASSARSDQVPARFRAVLTFLSWLEEAARPLLADTRRAEFAMLSGRRDVRVPGLGSALAAKVGTRQGVTKRCRLSLLTNCAFVIRVQMRAGGGGSCGVLANECSCAHHVTWRPSKLWRPTSIFNLCWYLSAFLLLRLKLTC